MLWVLWHIGSLINLEDRSILKSSLWDSKPTTVTAHVEEEFPQGLLLARTSLHQWPFIRFATLGTVRASNKKPGFVELDHFIVEGIDRLGLIWFGVWWSRTAEAVSAGKENEIEWIDIEGLVEVQTNISHGREGDSDAAAEIVHELLDLTEVSKVGAEVWSIDRSTLCGPESCEQECGSTSYEGRGLHSVFRNGYPAKN